MPFRSRSLRLRPINTLKHVIDSQQTIPAGTEINVDLVHAVENAVSTTANECDVGSQVSSLFVNIQVINSTNAVDAINNAYFFALLNPGSNLANIPNVNAVGISNNRKMIFHQEMVMLSDANDSIPITLFKGVLRIPRKARRLGVNDKMTLVIGTPTGGAEIDVCVQSIYKEVR